MDRLIPGRGRTWPLGAHAAEGGVNVCVPSTHATAVELCLFDDDGRHEHRRLPLHRSGDLWHGFVPGAGPGLVYGLRAHGPWRPDRGHRFNPHKLLLDPWAREIVGRFDWGPEHFGADPQHPLHQDQRDNAATALKARVVAEPAPVPVLEHPAHAAEDLVIYEVHVRNFSRLHPGVAPHERGTYLGLASEAGIAHLRALGVTAVCLLPVHQHLDEERLVRQGLVNHWGYNTIGFFCPSPRLATRPDGATARAEFRTLVQRLHAAGIEVLLDVVYNHTAEGDERGPCLSFRGLDNASWYRLPHEHRSGYDNWTGCGNTVNVDHPRALQLVLDSLRYWVQAMGVDGFRFDLAPVLGRGDRAFERHGAFFKALQQDPVLARARLIAEPWDLGPGGYQLGHFPRGWLEWNDRFRDTARSFFLGHASTRGELARRLAGSSDVLQAQGRSPLESVNYVVSHDGFTLRDLLSYGQRRNQANGEDNRDGTANNLGWNCGAEGDSHDPAVLQRRSRLARTLLATVLLSQGTPMVHAGDELGHTQGGNNNPYCQDNATSWIDWSGADAGLQACVARLLMLRRRHLPFGARWTTGLPDARGRPDLAWSDAQGLTLSPEAWNDGAARALMAFIGSPARGEGPLLLLVNGQATATEFMLPAGVWWAWFDSASTEGSSHWNGSGHLTLEPHALVLLGPHADP